jgi:outer membrane protein OmpA-like peptidoglycan-associated protein
MKAVVLVFGLLLALPGAPAAQAGVAPYLSPPAPPARATLVRQPPRQARTADPDADIPLPPPPPPGAPEAAPAPSTAAPAPTPAPAPMPMVPQAPPAPPVIPPPLTVPTRPATPPAPATITADAPGEASAIPGGIRVTFGPGRADLNQASADAVRGLAAAVITTAPATATLTVTSHASGQQDDASTARRLSLSRGLAARSLLIGQGIASTRIYVKALGLAPGPQADAPPDRVDIIVTPVLNTAPPAQARPAP